MIIAKSEECFNNQNNIKCTKDIIIPDGFRELLQDLTVDVLKSQPADPLSFCIDWLTNRKRLRDGKDEVTTEKKKFGISFNKPGQGDPKSITKDEAKTPKQVINGCKLFTNIVKEKIENLPNSFEIKTMEEGEKIVLTDETLSDTIYIVQEGTFELSIDLPFGKSKIGEISAGGYFGDILEKVNFVAKSPGKLVLIKRTDIDPSIFDSVENNRELYKDFIDDLEIFEKLSPYEKRMLVDSLVLRSFNADETIIKQKDDGDEMFLLYEGFVSVTQDGKEISTVNEGGYFGELALINDQPREATVTSISEVKVLVVCLEIFKTIIERKCMDLLEDNLKKYTEEDAGDDEEDMSSVMDTPPKEKGNLPRKSVSAGKFNPEAFDDDDEDDGEMDEEMQTQDFTKTDDQRDRLRTVCKDILLFRCLDEEQLEVVIDSMFKKEVQPGDVVITRGEDGDNFYVIDNGLYDIIIPMNGVDTVVAQYDNKGSFGELALMYNTPRSATIVAKTIGLLWAMSRDMFRKIVLKKAFQKRLMYDNLLAQVPFLKELSSFERNNIADALRTKVYEPGTPVIKQGEEGLEMYFIEEGTVTIFIKFPDKEEPQEVGELDIGKYFGEMALINHKPRAATIVAKTKCKIAVLDRESFERLLGPCINVMKRNMLDYNAVVEKKDIEE